jgi:hypothetical protein
MLFGGLLKSAGGGGGLAGGEELSVLTVDGWIKFKVPRRVEALILEARACSSSTLASARVATVTPSFRGEATRS